MPLLQCFSHFFLIYKHLFFGLGTPIYFTVNSFGNNECEVNKSQCLVKCLLPLISLEIS